MVCPVCYSIALNGTHSASNIATRRLVTLMECSHCHSVFDPYERFGAAQNRKPARAA